LISRKEIHAWCSIPADQLEHHSGLKVPFRIVPDARALGELMAKEFVDEIEKANSQERTLNAIVPCGPNEWYQPFAQRVNEKHVSLKHLVVFHMDEMLDWEGKLLPAEDPSNFHSFMVKNFYSPIDPALAVPCENRLFLTPESYQSISARIARTEIDYTLGGIGQDAHLAFNEARRNPYHEVTLEEMRNSTARIQENNYDTMIALSQRAYGTAWQFQPPMSITLGVKECLKAKKVRIYSATGAWKQTALRIALFAPPTPDYPSTLLSEHPDACITVTAETARHPFSEHPEWKFRGVNEI
jgi:glucosamine-6-phosphate deaminase